MSPELQFSALAGCCNLSSDSAMLLPKFLAAALLFSATVLGAQTLPAGTALPVALNSTLNGKNDKPGQKIEGKLMQEVLLPSGSKLKSGSRVSGHVVSSSPLQLTVQFDALQDEGQLIPLNVGLRAMAASENVFQAKTPIDATSTDESSDEWVTRQVGGDVVFRGRGYVANDHGKVGKWSGSGVWGMLTAAGDCLAGETTGQEQALWVFSTTACGVYGFEDLRLAHAGKSPPLGQITLQSTKDVLVRGGSGWLLIVNSAPASPAAK